MSDSLTGKQSKKSRLLKKGLSMFSKRSRSPPHQDSHNASASISTSATSVPPVKPQDKVPSQLNPMAEYAILMDTLDGTPLPEHLPSLRYHNSPSILAVYRQILTLEKKEEAAYSRELSDDRLKRLIYARILGYLILEGPSDHARANVELEVNASDGNGEAILDVGKFYFDHYIHAFIRNKGRGTPASSSHSSRSSSSNSSRGSFDTCKAMVTVVEAPESHQQAKVNALFRDGFRCVISGQYDFNYVERSQKLQRDLRSLGTGLTILKALTYTECTHIFPESTNANISDSDAQGDIKLHYASSSVWTVMGRFGFTKAFEELNGNKVHRLQNILTLDPTTHTLFNKLLLWLEPVGGDIPNTYKLCLANSLYIDRSWKSIITFTTPDSVKLPVPSPAYLELHAACCRVANLSGAGQYIDAILTEMEEQSQDDDMSAEVL